MNILPSWMCVCVRVAMNPRPSVRPLNPWWPWKQEFQLTHHRSPPFSSCFVVPSLPAKTPAGSAMGPWQPPALSLLCFPVPLSSLPFSRSSIWAPLSCLSFCLIELFGRRARQTAPSMWGVCGTRGHRLLCCRRRVSFSPLLLHEWTWPR